MTTNACVTSAVELPAGGILPRPTAAQQLDLLAESIRLADAPAFFTVWLDTPDSMRLFVEPVVQAGLKTPHVIQSDNLESELNRLERRASVLHEDEGVVFLGCLSALHEEERTRFNAARERLLRLPTKMIFVESIADEGNVRLGFPDVLSLVSYHCRLFQRADEQDPFGTSDPLPAESDARNEASGVRIRRKLESDTLHLPEINPLIGKTVEIFIREENATAAEDPGCFHDLSPVEPLDEPTRKALRALLTEEQFRALVEVVNAGGPDVDAIRKLRAASMA